VNLHSVKQKHTLLVSLATGRNILIWNWMPLLFYVK
jgi:hypothetical protein